MCYVERSNGDNLQCGMWKILWRICSDMTVGMIAILGKGDRNVEAA
jgi:hypothetical protein